MGFNWGQLDRQIQSRDARVLLYAIYVPAEGKGNNEDDNRIVMIMVINTMMQTNRKRNRGNVYSFKKKQQLNLVQTLGSARTEQIKSSSKIKQSYNNEFL